MLRNLKIAIAIGVAGLGLSLAAADAQAGWGHHHHGHHHHGHHHHGWGHGGWGYGGWGHHGYRGGWGWGGSYTSLSIGIGLPGYTLDYPRRYPYIYPGTLSSYDYYGYSGYYPSIFGYRIARPYAPIYSSTYYAPAYASYSTYAPYVSSYYASSAGCAPVVTSNYCDPCGGYPALSIPANGGQNYAPSTVPNNVPAVPLDQDAPSTDAAPSVRHLLPNLPTPSNLTRSGLGAPAVGQGRGGIAARLTTAGRDSLQSVALAGPVTPDVATGLVPLSNTLLQAADAIFAARDYQQAAAAYARLTVRYGNHDELAVRRFIALVASGDCAQAAVMFETASMSHQALLTSALPAGGLAALYGPASAEREMHIEYLAAYALKRPDDGLALSMVGTWLELDGQTERAQLFMQRAASLAPGQRLATNPAHLVATDVSQ